MNTTLCHFLSDNENFFLDISNDCTLNDLQLQVMSIFNISKPNLYLETILIASDLLLQEILTHHRLQQTYCTILVENQYFENGYHFNDKSNIEEHGIGENLIVSGMEQYGLNGIWTEIKTDLKGTVYKSPLVNDKTYYLFQIPTGKWIIDTIISYDIQYPFARSDSLETDWEFCEWETLLVDMNITDHHIQVNSSINEINGKYIPQPNSNNINDRRTYSKIDGTHIIFQDGNIWKIGKEPMEDDDIIIKSKLDCISNEWEYRVYKYSYYASFVKKY